jgi:hypothetical protein
MYRIPKRFKAYELVDRATYAKFGESAFMLFRHELLLLLDELSAAFPGKAITVNNWKSGGSFDSRGLRTPTDPTGAPYSAHRLGAAVDFNVAGMASKAVYEYIMANPDKFPHARRIEDPAIATGWTHLDTLDHPGEGIKVVKP